jgi:hypothetical protein
MWNRICNISTLYYASVEIKIGAKSQYWHLNGFWISRLWNHNLNIIKNLLVTQKCLRANLANRVPLAPDIYPVSHVPFPWNWRFFQPTNFHQFPIVIFINTISNFDLAKKVFIRFFDSLTDFYYEIRVDKT